MSQSHTSALPEPTQPNVASDRQGGGTMVALYETQLMIDGNPAWWADAACLL